MFLNITSDSTPSLKQAKHLITPQQTKNLSDINRNKASDSFRIGKNPKAQSFAALEKATKTKIYTLFKSLKTKSGGAIFPVIFDQNGATYFTIKPNEFETFEYIQKLCSSPKIQILVGKEKTFQTHGQKSLHKPVFIINIEKQKKLIQERLEFYRRIFFDPNLTVDSIYNRLTQENSPLMDVENQHEAMGHFLGYPISDVVMYDLKKKGIPVPDSEIVSTKYVQFASCNKEHWQEVANKQESQLDQKLGASPNMKNLFHHLIALNLNPNLPYKAV